MFYFFLIWNLFLAFLPLMVSFGLTNNINLMEKKKYFYPILLIWLLLLPNAPYILTDFIHLKHNSAMPTWFDVTMLSCFSVCGIASWLYSVKDIYNVVSMYYGNRTAWISVCTCSFLSGFGIYLGRFLRYNSWDVVQKPLLLISDIYTSLTSAPAGMPSWGLTLGFGFTLIFLFMLFHHIESKKIYLKTLKFKVLCGNRKW